MNANPRHFSLLHGDEFEKNLHCCQIYFSLQDHVVLALNIDSVLTITGVTASPGTGSDPVTCNAPVPGLINTNLVLCSIPSLGGPKASNPVTVMKVTVNITAPNQNNLQLLPGGTLSFDGIDTSNPNATIVIRVH